MAWPIEDSGIDRPLAKTHQKPIPTHCDGIRARVFGYKKNTKRFLRRWRRTTKPATDRLGKNKKRERASTSKGMQQGALGLADMPAEIIAHILGRVSSLGDLAACLAASSIFCAAPLDRAAAERTDVGMTKLLAAGAPLWVIRHVVHERAIERVPPHWIQWSAQGGRVDVIEWVCDLACTPSSADHDDNGSNGGDGSEPEIASPPR
ncbi:MAG TPA: hypothetical protein VIO38_09860, partial [Rariglobus sp.]